MSSLKKLTQKRLFLPIFSMILVMFINVIYDIACGNMPLQFFVITIKNGVLYGRLIDVLNRGSEIAILAIGMTLVVSSSAGTDISVGSVMSLYAGVCCMILAGYGNVNVSSYAHPLRHVDPVVGGACNRSVALQQPDCIRTCTFFPENWRIHRNYPDTNYCCSNLYSYCSMCTEVYRSRNLYSECWYQQKSIQNCRI